MLDAKKLLDALVGSAAAGRPGAGAPGGGLPGGLGSLPGGLGAMLNDVVGQLTKGTAGGTGSAGTPAGGGAGDLLGKAQDYLRSPQGNMAASAVIGGLAGLLMGSKTGRQVAGSAAKLGGLALIGGLAYKAYRNWQSGQQAAPAPAPGEPAALPPPQNTPFSVDTASQDTALVLLRAMVAAAASDGHVDSEERARIVGGLRQAGFDVEAAHFLDTEFANPASVTMLASAATTPELAAQVYTAARLAIEPDTPQERGFLRDLAGALALDSQLVAHIDAAAATVKAPA